MTTSKVRSYYFVVVMHKDGDVTVHCMPSRSRADEVCRQQAFRGIPCYTVYELSYDLERTSMHIAQREQAAWLSTMLRGDVK